MVRTIQGVGLVGVFMLGACMFATESHAEGIKWETSATKAKQTALSSGRNVLVYVGADFCGYCRKLEYSTWSNSSVADHVANKFVPLKVDGMRSPDLARQLGVRAFPATILMSPSGTVISRMDGYVDARTMLSFLQPPRSTKTEVLKPAVILR